MKHSHCAMMALAAALAGWGSQSFGAQPAGGMFGVTYGAGKFVAVGNGGAVFTSPDGFAWAAQSLPFYPDLRGVAYGDGLFVAGGRGDSFSTLNRVLHTSPDGAAWTPVADTGGGPGTPLAVTHGGGAFVAVGDLGMILRSTDGVAWTNHVFNSNITFYAVTHANGQFVAVGEGSLPPQQWWWTGLIYTSSNGIHWTLRAQPVQGQQAVTHGNGLYVSAGDYGNRATSFDGVNWTEHQGGIATNQPPSTNAPTVYFQSLAHGFGKFLAGSSSGEILSSLNGVHWTTRRVATYVPLNSIAVGGGRAVAVGGYEFGVGAIRVTTNGQTWADPFQPLTAPLLTQQPWEQSVLAGYSATFNAAAAGNPQPIYQWRKNGADLPGATEMELTFAAATTNDAGLYTVVAFNELGSVTSAPVRLEVIEQAPYFYQQPWSQEVAAGSSLYLYAASDGAPPPAYQWFFNGTPLAGQTNFYLYLSSVTGVNAGEYSVTASNYVGVATSWTADVRVPPMVIFQQPAPAYTTSGGSFFLDVRVQSFLPILSYQWRLNGANVPGANQYYYQPFGVTPAQAGNYDVVIHNTSGAVTSRVAVVGIDAMAPYFTSHPPTQTAYAGGNAYFGATVIGTTPFAYQWRHAGTNIPGATNPSFIRLVLKTNDAGAYDVVVGNPVGVSTSMVAQLTVLVQAPVFSGHPQSQSVGLASWMYLNCGASGIPFPDFQWQFNGTNIAGATNTWLYFPSVGSNDAGQYRVIASNVAGVATSQVATVTVFTQAPIFTAQPQSQAVYWSQDASFHANAYGAPAPAYQWQFDGVDIPGQRAPSLHLSNVSTNDAGGYTVVISNFLGSVTSTVAYLVVNTAPPGNVHISPNQTVLEGSTVYLSGGAFGAPAPALLLRFQGQPLAHPFSPSGGFTLLDVTTNDSGPYQIVATNFYGAATSVVSQLTVVPGGPLDRWKRRNPLPQEKNLLSVAHGAGRYVAVGETGAIVTSTDGANWTAEPLRTDSFINAVTFGSGLFVAAGGPGNILTSTNGVNWTPRLQVPDNTLFAVAYGNGRFVAGGYQVAYVSTNGLDWEDAGFVSPYIRGLAFGNGRFVSAGDPVGQFPFWTSTDGVNWEPAAHQAYDYMENIAYGGGQFVAVGSGGTILTSGDGVAWTRRTTSTFRRLIDVAYGNGRFIAVGARGTMLSSTDGAAWAVVDPGTPDRLEGIGYGGGLFVAVGENGTTITSPDGVAWAKQNRGPTRDLDGMTLGPGLLAAVGKFGAVITSTDGVHYAEQVTGTTNDLHGIAWGGGLYVAVGDPGVIITSTNARDWNVQTSGTFAYLKSVAYGDGAWVAVGSLGTILSSTDGATWTPRASGTFNELQDVAWGNGLFMAVGDSFNTYRTVRVSTNGIDWLSRDVNSSKNLRSILFTNDQFVITANDGLLLTTTNGSSYQFRYTPYPFNGYNVRGAAWAAGQWVVVGNYGYIHTSSNLVNWTTRVSRTRENLHGVRWFNGTFVTIGNRGTVLQSGRPLGPELRPRGFTPGGEFELGLDGEFGVAHRVQHSADLDHWTDLVTVTNIATTVPVRDPAPPPSRRFYRALAP